MPSVKDAFAGGGTLVFGHRGACGHAPMNTLPSFRKVVEIGADGTEFDVRLTRDGHMVIIHDPSVDDTTDGSGIVSEMSFAEIRELDAGAWYDGEFRGTRIPTLDEVLETLGKSMVINIEIKSEVYHPDGVEAQVAEAIRRHGIDDLAIVSSFNPLVLRRFYKIAPHVPIAYLHHPAEPHFLTDLMHGLPHNARNPHYSEINPNYMRWAKAHGYRVNTYTVNDPEIGLRMRDLGVSSVISDVPDMILSALRG